MNLKPILQAVLDEYSLPLDGPHGVAHWARVLENGLRVAEESGADATVVSLFAVLHDSRRQSEAADPLHGQRAADFAAELWGHVFQLGDDQFRLLYRACKGHTHERTHDDVTIQTCWDADRLDLGRVGITPLPHRLCTDVARSREVLDWADRRASCEVIPEFVADIWEIELDSST
ncbi:MAG: hypothetical protein RIC55_15130 [Pirellulaceae bacterium]